MALMSKPIADRPELKALLTRAKVAWEEMPDAKKREMIEMQRRSWVIGEIMLEHPDMPREQAERLYDEIY